MLTAMAEPFQGVDTKSKKEVANSQRALQILKEKAEAAGLTVSITYAMLQGWARAGKIEVVEGTKRNAFYSVESLNTFDIVTALTSSQVGKRRGAVPKEIRDKAVEMVGTGMSHAQVARELSATYDRPIVRQDVRRWVENAETTQEVEEWKRDLLAQMIPMYVDKGMTLQQVSDAVGGKVKPGTVSLWLKEAGVTIRPKPIGLRKEQKEVSEE